MQPEETENERGREHPGAVAESCKASESADWLQKLHAMYPWQVHTVWKQKVQTNKDSGCAAEMGCWW